MLPYAFAADTDPPCSHARQGTFLVFSFAPFFGRNAATFHDHTSRLSSDETGLVLGRTKLVDHLTVLFYFGYIPILLSSSVPSKVRELGLI